MRVFTGNAEHAMAFLKWYLGAGLVVALIMDTELKEELGSVQERVWFFSACMMTWPYWFVFWLFSE